MMLRKMTEEEYARFKDDSIAEYAQDLICGSGLDSESAFFRAEREFNEELPDGLETEGQYLMMILDDADENVGYIWFSIEEEKGVKRVWLADFLIYEEERGKGHAIAALTEMEKMAKEAGCSESALYVWDHNPAGYGLYQKCGYQIFVRQQGGALMKKSL